MEINSYSIFMAVVLSSIASSISYFIFKNQKNVNKLGVISMLTIYLACILRLLIPLELPFTFVIHDFNFSTEFYYWFGIEERSILGFTLTYEKVFLIIWIIGIMINLFAIWIRYIRINKKLSSIGGHVNPNDQALLSNIKNELNKSYNISVIRCKHVDTPFVIGIIKPRIYLPDLEYDDDILYCILMHEYIHFINHDTIIKLLILVFCSIFWWNPIVYLLKKLINKTLEIKCDLSVVSNTDNIEKYLNSILAVIKGNNTVLSSDSKKDIVERFKIISDNSVKSKSQINFIQTTFIIIVFTIFISSYSIQFQPAYEPPEIEMEMTNENTYIIDNEDGSYDMITIIDNTEYIDTTTNKEIVDIMVNDSDFIITTKDKEDEIKKNFYK